MAKSFTNSKAKNVKKLVPKRVAVRAKNHTKGFIDFIRTQGVVGLAIGFIVGTQAKSLVDQFSKSFIDPILGMAVGNSQGLSNKVTQIWIGEAHGDFAWGAFVYALINFIVVALVVYIVFKTLHLDKLDKKKD